MTDASRPLIVLASPIHPDGRALLDGGDRRWAR
jgi:hypothetical protein